MKKQTPSEITGGHILLWLFLWALAGFQVTLEAFPPAPDHLIYGQVRDEFGNPLTLSSAKVYLESSAGVRVSTKVVAGLEPGVNYKLSIPMDSGITSDQYKPTALRPAVPFKMWVMANGTTYLPIEMKLKTASLGAPGGRTRIDLTLGEDADGDGLPDAWERAMIAELGLDLDINNFNPGDDLDHDGLTNLQEYLAGTYAFDPADGFSLKIIPATKGKPALEFLAIRGRTYTLLGSEDAVHWSPLSFKLAGSTDSPAPDYYASDVRTMRIEADDAQASAPAMKFFKLLVR